MKTNDVAINALRVISNEMITKAKSGHPGICLGSAPILHTLFTNYIHVPLEDKKWFNRDRFILSAGHGSAILYTLLHVCGFDISIEDLKEFRQKGSKTPGHPEYGHTDGVEMTTGPLGQGVATSVGLAIAEKYLAARYNKKDITLFDYKTFVLCGDGDLQEGLTQEAVSLAGNLKLNNLILLYDSNDIQLDGPTNKATNENVKLKFEAMNWSYYRVEDGNDIFDLKDKIDLALKDDKPVIIEVKTIIGYGAYNAGTNAIHGKPLNEEQVINLKENLGYRYNSFEIPKEVYELYDNTFKKNGTTKYNKYLVDIKKYEDKYKEDYLDLIKTINQDVFFDINNCPSYDKAISTRKASGNLVTYLSSLNNNIIAGSADLVSSTMISGNDGDFSSSNYLGRNVCYGVREHAMGSICNGLVLAGLKSVVAGFFVFSDYLKDSIREAAIMHIPSLFVFSHDSVCVGEDGPTHQPIEQLAGLRAMPNLNVVRPADAKEVTYLLSDALANKYTYPTVITTSRQDVPVLVETSCDCLRGAYIVYEPQEVKYILLTCGTELDLCLNVAKNNDGIRVVSMPSMFMFEKQDEEYKKSILPNKAKTLAVELGATMPWYKYADKVLGIDEFGQSMPLKEIYNYFGFTKENILNLLDTL